jgi:CheY-like chemotaxis protein
MARLRANHVLVWMRDGDLAARVRTELESLNLPSTWAASLPEAIGAVDEGFPRVVACTLGEEAPSLMDLETLLAYLSMGHGSVLLPPIPIWAMTPRAAEHAGTIQELNLPIRLVPLESGVEGLLAEIVHYLRAQGSLVDASPEQAFAVLFLGPDPSAGFYLSRFLGTRGIPTIPCETPRAALRLLAPGAFEALVVDLPHEAGALDFLREVEQRAPGLPVVALVEPAGWIGRLAPPALPPTLSTTLAKPVRAERLEACLRRLLRIASVGISPVGSERDERWPGESGIGAS